MDTARSAQVLVGFVGALFAIFLYNPDLSWAAVLHLTLRAALGDYAWDEFTSTATVAEQHAGLAMYMLLILICNVLLLNMLIAMMSSTYALIEQRSKQEFLVLTTDSIFDIAHQTTSIWELPPFNVASVSLGKAWHALHQLRRAHLRTDHGPAPPNKRLAGGGDGTPLYRVEDCFFYGHRRSLYVSPVLHRSGVPSSSAGSQLSYVPGFLDCGGAEQPQLVLNKRVYACAGVYAGDEDEH